jgi:ParB family chromosome partitioning protein
MVPKKGLGKGIFALVDENEFEQVDASQQNAIDVNKIIPNRYQPRQQFDEDSLKELSESIAKNGVIQPVLVSEMGDGRYELVAGERRLRAAKMAGLMEIPAVVRSFTEEQRIEFALIENIQREDLNPVEVAQAYKEIMERMKLTQEELADHIGKSRTAVANTLRLLHLPEYVRKELFEGRSTEGHARAILSIGDIDRMIDFTKFIVESGISVREAEKQAKTFLEKFAKENVSRETKPTADNEMDRLQEALTTALGAKVSINGSRRKGKITIAYFSQQELENLYKSLAGRR